MIPPLLQRILDSADRQTLVIGASVVAALTLGVGLVWLFGGAEEREIEELLNTEGSPAVEVAPPTKEVVEAPPAAEPPKRSSRAEQIARKINAEVARGVDRYLKMTAAADTAELEDTVQRHAETLAWIEDEAMRREVLWSLVCALMDRGRAEQAEGALESILPPTAPENQETAARMLQAARGLAQAGKWEKARRYYRSVSEALNAWGMAADAEGVLRERIGMPEVAGMPRREAVAELESLLPVVEQSSPALRIETQVFLGKLHQELGERGKAEEYFRAALEGLPREQAPEAATTAICAGIALMEVGEHEAAEAWLRSGLVSLGAAPAWADHRIMALRHLALLELENGKPQEAIASLYRAEGEARGRISEENALWLFLAEQRAWAFFILRAYDEALVDFRWVLAASPNEALRAQPLEGVARCCLAMGQVEPALQAATECAALRGQYVPEDKESLARVLIVQGQAQDLTGQIQQAAETYARAAELLPQEHPDRHQALLGQAHAMTQLHQWETAIGLWKELIPQLPKSDSLHREEARKQLEHCEERLATINNPNPTPKKTVNKPNNNRRTRGSQSRSRR